MIININLESIMLWITSAAIISFSLAGIIACVFFLLKKRQCIYALVPDVGEWLDIKKNPIPIELKETQILLTDGDRVQLTYLQYNEKGNAIIGGFTMEKEVTFWGPKPLPPKASQ